MITTKTFTIEIENLKDEIIRELTELNGRRDQLLKDIGKLNALSDLMDENDEINSEE